VISQSNNQQNTSLPNFLNNYYEAEISPFVNLSDLPLNGAETYLKRIRRIGNTLLQFGLPKSVIQTGALVLIGISKPNLG